MDLETRAVRALCAASVDAVITGVTALHLHGVEVGEPLPVRLVTATTAQTRRLGVRLARAPRLPPAIGQVAQPLAAWLAAGHELDLVDTVAAGDALVRLGLCEVADLTVAGASSTGRGCRTLRRAGGLVRERVESVRETQLRLCLVLAGLPEPRCNVTLGDDRPIGRVDLLLDGYGVILEYDGDQHRDRGQWNLDLDRDDAFSAAGFVTVRVTRDRMRQPREVVSRVHARLLERGYEGPSPHFDALWCALFEHRE